jgi:uncharacterized protein (TIGR03435 family)
MRLRWFAACVIIGLSAHLLAQSPGDLPTFEIVSIKPSGPTQGRGVSTASSSPETYARRNTFLRQLITDAYNLQPLQVVGIPPALGANVRFDVVAKSSFIPTAEQRTQMVQRLLADRFALRAHRETRALQVYVLRLGKDFGRSAGGFRKTNVNCAAIKAQRANPDGNATPPINAQGRPACSGFWSGAATTASSVDWVCNGVTLNELANLLAGYVGRIVVDETSLPGDFDGTLIFDPSSGRAPGSATPGTAPSIFTALSDAGLKLESTTAPVDVLVVDHIERPTVD